MDLRVYRVADMLCIKFSIFQWEDQRAGRNLHPTKSDFPHQCRHCLLHAFLPTPYLLVLLTTQTQTRSDPAPVEPSYPATVYCS